MVHAHEAISNDNLEFCGKSCNRLTINLQVFFDNYTKSFCWFKWEFWEIQIVQSIGLLYIAFVFTDITYIKLLAPLVLGIICLQAILGYKKFRSKRKHGLFQM
jgi:hypothetical protein